MDKFYLVGDLNNWQLGMKEFMFKEVVNDYGCEKYSGTYLQMGEYTLEVDLPAHLVKFKIIQGNDWVNQWSVMSDSPLEIGQHRFLTRDGIDCALFVHRTSTNPSHAEFIPKGERLRYRFDFHPASQTLAIHPNLQYLPGMKVFAWRDVEFQVDYLKFSYRVYVVLPFGFYQETKFQYPICFFFDGRNLIYGEDPTLNIFHNWQRQYPRVFTTLSRLGIIPPMIMVGIEVPRCISENRDQAIDYRSELYLGKTKLYKIFSDSLVSDLLPALEAKFPTASTPDNRYLLGHSNGSDMSLLLLSDRPDTFCGAICISPGNACRMIERLEQSPKHVRHKMRIYLSFSEKDLRPSFLVNTALAKRLLKKLEIPHLIQYAPHQSHDPECGTELLYAALGFVIS